MQVDSTLLVDAGNTRIKYRWLNEDPERVHTVADIPQLLAQLASTSITNVFLSNVGNQQAETHLTAFCRHHRILLHTITTPKSGFGIENSYARPEKMGVDRWLAMVGAKAMTNKPFAVVDAGTAVTVDFVAEGKHLGGWILPGYHTMKQALVGSTTRVTDHQYVPSTLIAANDTEDCVAMGCLAAVQGAVLAANQYLTNRYDEYLVICTGGDKNLLTSVEGGGNLSAANLVIDGLARYAEKASCI